MNCLSNILPLRSTLSMSIFMHVSCNVVQSAAAIALAGAVLLTSVGCATNPASPTGASAVANSNHPQIEVAGWLHDRDRIVAIEEGVVQGDMKRIAVDLIGDPERSRKFGYRFEWFDAAGMPTGPANTAVTVVRLRAKERMTLTSIAPTAASVRWKLTFENAPE
jgi:uncharacterized protein YcfL